VAFVVEKDIKARIKNKRKKEARKLAEARKARGKMKDVYKTKL